MQLENKFNHTYSNTNSSLTHRSCKCTRENLCLQRNRAFIEDIKIVLYIYIEREYKDSISKKYCVLYLHI